MEFLGFWTLSIVQYFQRTHDVSETGSVSVLRQKRLKGGGGEDPYSVGSLRKS
jgi:hypothetical protein